MNLLKTILNYLKCLFKKRKPSLTELGRSKLTCGCGWTIRLYVGKKTHFFYGVWVDYKLIRGRFSR